MSTDVHLIREQLQITRASLLASIGDNPLSPLHGLVNQMAEEEAKLSGVNPEMLTIFAEANMLSPALHLLFAARSVLSGVMTYDGPTGFSGGDHTIH